MSKLNVDQKTVKELFSNKKTDFLIPDYQRPYAWTEIECATLWDDIFSFAFPDNDYSRFDSDNDEYFLGPIVTFKNDDGKFDVHTVRNHLSNFGFYNARPITKSMLAWWAFHDDHQGLLSLETVLEIEHIYARNRNEKEHTLSDAKSVDRLGNKSLLEKRINIRASDYRFADKVTYYKGYVNRRGQQKEATRIRELLELSAGTTDFTEADIFGRTERIISTFLTYLSENGLTQ